MNWFDVDKAGLAKLLERKGKEFVLFELIQNAWDTNAKNVRVALTPIAGSPYATLIVQDDDPLGFTDLKHAFTLFAESEKKGDVEKRGRFNIGEKLVLALCREATIETKTGSVRFDRDGRRKLNRCTESGSTFTGEIRMTRDEIDQALAAVKRLLPPVGISTLINQTELKVSAPVLSFKHILPTEAANEEGYLVHKTRMTQVTLHDVRDGEVATLYEMGIPVVELESHRWHVNVHQKVPLNIDRDNVTPAYLRTLNVAVLNNAHEMLRAEDATSNWARDAASNPNASANAVKTTIDLRFGEKRVIFDPSDPEGTKMAVAQGYTVVTGGALSAGEWDNVKRHELALPAGQVTPSPKPYSPDGDPEKVIPVTEWTAGMELFAERAGWIGHQLMGVPVTTRFVKEPGVYWRATYGRGGSLAINISKVGKMWFEPTRSNHEDQLGLLIHEFGHEYASDHLSDEYHRALCRLGAKLAMLSGDLQGLRPL